MALSAIGHYKEPDSWYNRRVLKSSAKAVCSEYLIEAKVDVGRLLQHSDWRVRAAALGDGLVGSRSDRWN
jgi:hypothetical protein